MVSSEDRGRAAVSSLALVGAILVVAGGVSAAFGPGSAGVIGSMASGNDGTAETATPTPSATATATSNATSTESSAESSTATPTDGPTPTPTATPGQSASSSRDVVVLFEHWDDKVGIVVEGGADADAVTQYTVEGAEMESTLDPEADHPRAVGTVDAPTTVRVVATFEDGTRAVVGERRIE